MADAPPHLRSQAYAWSLFFYALGAIIVFPAIGVISDAHGERIALGILGVLVVIGGLIAVSARRFVQGDLDRAAAAAAADSAAAHSTAAE